MSVFVGNIPFDATEQHVEALCSEVGKVVSFRLVFDRETGRSKGYGFCRYEDEQTLQSAIRNLNGRRLNGRPLRVDFATQRRRERPRDHRHRAETNEINEALDALSTNELHQLVSQMKAYVQQNTPRAREILTANPQLAWALLQAQVILGIVPPSTAEALLQAQRAPRAPRPPIADAATLDQVLRLTPQQIQALPPETQRQVMVLQQQIRESRSIR